MSDDSNRLLRELPAADELIRSARSLGEAEYAHADLRDCARRVIANLREKVLSGKLSAVPPIDSLAGEVVNLARQKASYSLKPVINATGIILHTNLGRAALAGAAAEHVKQVAENYSTLEYRLDVGERGSRNELIEHLICRLTGCESALVVNNNAAAVLLALSAHCRGSEVVISRGELVEIGGSFRVPDIMALSGAVLREVGTTNKTRLSDYESAIVPGVTGALLKVHTSNFKLVGFTEDVPLPDLVELGRRFDIPVIYDLGSGALADLSPLGLPGEPTVPKAVEAGADLITFSGDKLLGGPQCGIIAGCKRFIEPLKTHPLTRALRIDKLCLAALEATLRPYIDPEAALNDIPVLSMLAAGGGALRQKAEDFFKCLPPAAALCAEVIQMDSQVGGGSVPGELLPSWGVAVSPRAIKVGVLEEHLRLWDVPIIARISKGRLLMDIRTIREDQFSIIADAFRALGENL